MSGVDDITICVPTFLRDDSLFRCVDSIRKVHPTISVVVADDGRHSDLKTEHLNYLDVHYIPLSFDSGLAAKRNAMIDEVSTQYVALMDDDMILTEEVRLDNLKTLMDISDLAAGRLSYIGNKKRDRTYLARMVFQPMALRMLPPNSGWQKHEGITYRQTDLALNCFVARRDMLRTLRWDERFKITYEHTDFFIRLHLSGAKVVFSPDSVFHEERARNPEYRTYRLRKEEHEKVFFQKWGFSKIVKYPLLK